MTSIWSAHEAAKATGGRAQSHWQVSSIVIDSREAGPGDLFVALKGEKADGHDFVTQALAKGAVAMVSHVPEGTPENAPLLIVKDCYQALLDLAAFNRRRSQARIIAVTGSVGKTGTKEALRCAFGGLGEVYATSGNYNNHLGVPISLARMNPAVDFAVFELGMNHEGEIAALTRQVRPMVAIITTVDAVHLEFFASVEAIADAKAEIFLGMDTEGTAVLNHDNPHFERLKQAALHQGIKHILSFGMHEEASCRLVDYRQKGEGCRITATILGQNVNYSLQAAGLHHAMNSLAVLAAVAAFGENVAQAAAALSDFSTPMGRGNHQLLELDGKQVTIIDDSYNASPASVKAALQLLGQTGERRKVAILGDMLELGDSASLLHQGLLDTIVASGIDKVIAVGPHMQQLYAVLPPEKKAGHYMEVKTLFPEILGHLQAGDTLLIKGSHGTQMFRLVEFLLSSIKP